MARVISNYGRDYLRNPILGLMQYNKPIIVEAYLQSKQVESYYTFKNVKPFHLKHRRNLKVFCDHINISKLQVDRYFTDDLRKSRSYMYVLVCNPYTYIGDNGENRGGLDLTNSLGIPPIMTISEAMEKLKDVDPSLYVDYTDFADGRYIGIDIKKINERKKHEKYLRKQERKKQRAAEVKEVKKMSDKQWDNALRSKLKCKVCIDLSEQPDINNIVDITDTIKVDRNKSDNITLSGWNLRI